jgi:hypothetical protein
VGGGGGGAGGLPPLASDREVGSPLPSSNPAEGGYGRRPGGGARYQEDGEGEGDGDGGVGGGTGGMMALRYRTGHEWRQRTPQGAPKGTPGDNGGSTGPNAAGEEGPDEIAAKETCN